MLDVRLLGDRVRTTLVSWQQRALTTVSGQSSTRPAQLSPLRTRLAPLRTPQGRLALWRSAFPLLGFTAAYLSAYIYGNGLPRPAPLWPPDAILLSANSPEDAATLRETIIEFFEAAMVEDELVLPYAKQGFLNDVYENARVLSEDYDSTGRIMKIRGLPGAVARLRRTLAAS